MLNLEIEIKDQALHLCYFPRVTVKGVFTFNNNDLVKFDHYYETAVFRLGKKDGEYWTIPGAILRTNHPI